MTKLGRKIEKLLKDFRGMTESYIDTGNDWFRDEANECANDLLKLVPPEEMEEIRTILNDLTRDIAENVKVKEFLRDQQ